MTPGPAVPQPRREAAAFTHGELAGTDERAGLNLNVFTPGVQGARPVLVWIHGGGFAIGHGGATIYDGARLAAAADVVVVTINYRLGSLGWLGHPELAATPGAAAANWGLLDQRQALRWVAANIAAFGGDPARVTLAGQSAGALSAIDLMLMPGSDGLFQRLVLHSPPLGDLVHEAALAERWAHDLSRAAGANGPWDGDRLRALPAQEIVDLHERLLATPDWAGTRGGALPALDPATLPGSMLDTPGARPELEVLIGATADEGTFFFGSPWRPAPPAERVPGIVAHLPGIDDAQDALALYRGQARERGLRDDPGALLAQIATDALVAGPVARWAAARAEGVAAAGGRVHRYRIDHPGAGTQLGATHTAEVPLLFLSWTDGGAGERLGGQAPGADAVAAAMVGAWAAFVHGRSPGWEPLGAAGGGDEIGVFGGTRYFRTEPAGALTETSHVYH